MNNEAEQPSRAPDMLSAKPTTKQKALFRAVKNGDVEPVRELVQAGVNVNFACPPERGYVAMTPLMVSCLEGYLDIVRLLLENGANVDATTQEFGCTALHYAVRSEKKESVPQIVAWLLERGANPNHRISLGWESVFVSSIRKGAVDTVKLLLAAGAHVNPHPEAATSALNEPGSLGCPAR